jgi:hypothetical protein
MGLADANGVRIERGVEPMNRQLSKDELAALRLPDGINCRALDEGIRQEVVILSANGVETFESCEGGDGHSFPEPTIRFHGTKAAGLHAVAVAMVHGLGVKDLRRVYNVEGGELVGPTWELTFYPDQLLARRVELGAVVTQALTART